MAKNRDRLHEVTHFNGVNGIAKCDTALFTIAVNIENAFQHSTINTVIITVIM